MKNSKKWSLAELSDYVHAKIQGDPAFVVSSLAPLDTACKEQLSFYHNSKYYQTLLNTQAGAVLISEKDVAGIQLQNNFLIVSSPYLAFAQLTKLFVKDTITTPVIHPTAVISEKAVVPASACIAAYVVIEEGTELGEGVCIGANTVIGKNVVIGSGTKIYPNVTLYDEVKIGCNCIIHSGAVIGSDGFGFARDKDGWCKIYHLGSVVVEDEVEVGANTTIDRGTLKSNDTVIAQGVKIDNQVQVGHNVQIGKNTVIAGCSGFAGSAKVGQNCIIGGKVGIVGHISIADGVVITGMTLVSKPLSEKAVYSSGITVKKSNQWKENIVRMRRIDKLWNWMKKVGGE